MPTSALEEPAYFYHTPTTSPLYRHVISPFCDVVCRYLLPGWLRPNTISIIGLLFALASVLAVELGSWKWTAILWIGYSLCDNLDGKQARYRQQSSACGEFLDHLVDSITSSLLALILVAVLLPDCHRQSLFNPWEMQDVYFSRDAITYVPLFVLVCMAQIPFYIGAWAHHKLGRLLLGGRTTENCRDLFTVDEVNLVVVPGLCVARCYWEWFARDSILRFRWDKVPFLPGIDCTSATWNSEWSITAASFVVAIFSLFTTFSLLRVTYKLIDVHTLHYLASLVTYLLIVFLLPVPPTVIIPVFSWITSCLIFTRTNKPYMALERQVELPPYTPFQVHKRWPLGALLFISMAIRYCAVVVDVEYAKFLTLFFTGALCTWLAIIARADMEWLNRSEIIRSHYLHDKDL
eukprot:Protomagalhaensia_wolfi_Nauph_80__6092@NODE_863_length_1933_cov_45_667899_g650_i0_p1_GENE_NODE_863_length_1933_cov_45_667899_g650_i0NODE_863_length_1933_cov_45_667899_g650_i0_p1_ORF_typecomplete_len406_score42_72CDPOH_P_transf/PF01066_21/2e15CDPOH_P_transf/PF01066_21/2_4e03_NODE_863_length_1933_cov_45_667899_g650_i0171234